MADNFMAWQAYAWCAGPHDGTHLSQLPHPSSPPFLPHLFPSPATQAKAQYMTVHDRVLATPQYRQAFNLANQLAARLEQTWLYSTARARLPASAVETGERGQLRAGRLCVQWRGGSVVVRCGGLRLGCT